MTDVLNGLGTDKDDFIKPTNKGGVYEIIYNFGAKFADDLAKKLQEFNDIDTGKLIDSFDFKIKNNGKDIKFSFSLNDYYQYLDQGRKPGGKLPFRYYKPGGVLFEWVKRNNYLMNGPHASKNKQQNQETLALLIGSKIKRNGRKGTKFFGNTVKDGRIEKLNQDLSKALGVDVVIEIKEFVKEIKNKK